jgi:hypothetical protein
MKRREVEGREKKKDEKKIWGSMEIRGCSYEGEGRRRKSKAMRMRKSPNQGNGRDVERVKYVI